MAHSCKHCGRIFDTKQHKEAHEETHEGKKYACDRCSKKYACAATLKRHKVSHLKQNHQYTNTMFSMCGPDFHCGECKASFKHEQAKEYNDHIDKHIEKSDFGKHMYPSKKN